MGRSGSDGPLAAWGPAARGRARRRRRRRRGGGHVVGAGGRGVKDRGRGLGRHSRGRLGGRAGYRRGADGGEGRIGAARDGEWATRDTLADAVRADQGRQDLAGDAGGLARRRPDGTNRCSTFEVVRGDRRRVAASIRGTASGRLGRLDPGKGVVREGRRSTSRYDVRCHRDPNFTRGRRSCAQELDQSRAGGGAQEQAQCQEDELAGRHAVRISLRSCPQERTRHPCRPA
jgi:hypothetical protein